MNEDKREKTTETFGEKDCHEGGPEDRCPKDWYPKDRYPKNRCPKNRTKDRPEGWPKGLKKTRQREDVYRVLHEAQEPLSAAEIFRRIEEEYRREGQGEGTYALSTVYRSLAAFEEKGYVVKTAMMEEDTALYEWNKGPHRHYAVCLGCHKLVPLKSCPFEHLSLETENGDFTVTDHRLELYGYCGDCANNRGGSE